MQYTCLKCEFETNLQGTIFNHIRLVHKGGKNLCQNNNPRARGRPQKSTLVNSQPVQSSKNINGMKLKLENFVQSYYYTIILRQMNGCYKTEMVQISSNIKKSATNSIEKLLKNLKNPEIKNFLKDFAHLVKKSVWPHLDVNEIVSFTNDLMIAVLLFITDDDHFDVNYRGDFDLSPRCNSLFEGFRSLNGDQCGYTISTISQNSDDQNESTGEPMDSNSAQVYEYMNQPTESVSNQSDQQQYLSYPTDEQQQQQQGHFPENMVIFSGEKPSNNFDQIQFDSNQNDQIEEEESYFPEDGIQLNMLSSHRVEPENNNYNGNHHHDFQNSQFQSSELMDQFREQQQQQPEQPFILQVQNSIPWNRQPLNFIEQTPSFPYGLQIQDENNNIQLKQVLSFSEDFGSFRQSNFQERREFEQFCMVDEQNMPQNQHNGIEQTIFQNINFNNQGRNNLFN